MTGKRPRPSPISPSRWRFSPARSHFSVKSAPANINFAVSLVVTYAVAIVTTSLAAFLCPSPSRILAELKQLNWASSPLAQLT